MSIYVYNYYLGSLYETYLTTVTVLRIYTIIGYISTLITNTFQVLKVLTLNLLGT